MEWKWMKGEPCKRSSRIQQMQINETKKKVTFDNETRAQEIDVFSNSSTLNYEECVWETNAQDNYQNGFKVSNKREDIDSKIADRYLVQQIGRNPFLSNTNYLEDVNIRDKFLKPINTTSEKEQNSVA